MRTERTDLLSDTESFRYNAKLMPTPYENSSAVERPTRVRFVVVGMAILLGMVTYLDRATLGNLAKPMMCDLKLSQYQLSYAQTAFALAYGSFGILSAWWADRVGTRWMLTAVVIAWSVFTINTGLAQGMVSLIIIQFCFGAAEAGAWPAITRTLSRWIPYGERHGPGHRVGRRTPHGRRGTHADPRT